MSITHQTNAPIKPITPKNKNLHGVWQTKNGNWAARIRLSRYNQMWLGSFETQREAGLAYDRAARTYRPDVELNFPLEQIPAEMTVIEERIMQRDPATAPIAATQTGFTFAMPKKDAPAFNDLLNQAAAAMDTTNRSDVLRTATTIGLQQIVNPTAPATPTPTLPPQTIRNLAMLGSLLIAVRKLPQVAPALTDAIETYIDATNRDMDALSAFLDTE